MLDGSTLLELLLFTTLAKPPPPLPQANPDFSDYPGSQVIAEGPFPWPQCRSAVITVQPLLDQPSQNFHQGRAFQVLSCEAPRDGEWVSSVLSSNYPLLAASLSQTTLSGGVRM